MSIPNISSLVQALQEHALTLFIGADLPQEMTGLPSRADLALGLAQREGISESSSLAAVAQRIGLGGFRFKFTDYIRDRLDTTAKPPQPFHGKVVQLVQKHQVETVIATAYDNLLELAFRDAHVRINRVVCGSDVGMVRRGRPTLIKLYGDTQQPESLVVTEDDHYGLWQDRRKELLLNELRSVLHKNAVLFIGYNLTDPDFNLLWREVLDRAGRFVVGAFVAWPDPPKDEQRVWEDRQVRVIDMPVMDLLNRLVGQSQIAMNAAGHFPTREKEGAGPTDAPSNGMHHVDPENPPTAAIRALLEASFSDDTLLHFCRDLPDFRPLVSRFSTKDGLTGMVEKVIEYCEEFLKWDELLAEVKNANPRQYARFEPKLFSNS